MSAIGFDTLKFARKLKEAGVPEQQAEALSTALTGLNDQGLEVAVESTKEPEQKSQYSSISLVLIGHDKPGIVKEISQALAANNINVERLSTELTSGSMSAEELFKAEADLLVPEKVDLDDLQHALESIASDLMVDITIN